MEDGTVSKLSPQVQQILVCAVPGISRRAINETILFSVEEVATARATREVICKSPKKCNMRSRAADERMLLFIVEAGAALQGAENLCSCGLRCNRFVKCEMDIGR